MRTRVNTTGNGGRKNTTINTGDMSSELDSIEVVRSNDVVARVGRNSWRAKCLKCGKVFNSFNELEVHMFYKHDLVVCPHCYSTANSHKVYRNLVATGNFECGSCCEHYREDEF